MCLPRRALAGRRVEREGHPKSRNPALTYSLFNNTPKWRKFIRCRVNYVPISQENLKSEVLEKEIVVYMVSTRRILSSFKPIVDKTPKETPSSTVYQFSSYRKSNFGVFESFPRFYTNTPSNAHVSRNPGGTLKFWIVNHSLSHWG